MLRGVLGQTLMCKRRYSVFPNDNFFLCMWQYALGCAPKDIGYDGT